jgi:hypothetical protein
VPGHGPNLCMGFSPPGQTGWPGASS